MILEQTPTWIWFQHIGIKGVIIGHLPGCELIFVLLVSSGHAEAENMKLYP